MDNKMHIECTCVMCGRDYEIWVDPEGYDKWTAGMAIQDALPDLIPGQRELMLSGICEKCFDDLFGESRCLC